MLRVAGPGTRAVLIARYPVVQCQHPVHKMAENVLSNSSVTRTNERGKSMVNDSGTSLLVIPVRAR